MASDKSSGLGKALLFGVISIGLYFLLYLYSAEVMNYAAQGGWYFIIPVAIAFLFSYIHGNFTSFFWDALGIKAKSNNGKK